MFSRIFSTKVWTSSLRHCSSERTFIAVKPDGVQRGLIAEVMGRFERRGYKLCAIKMIHPTKAELDAHYSQHIGKDYYPNLMKQLGMGPMILMVWQGLNVIRNARAMIGPTKPEEALPGTIRGDLCQFKRRNIVHGSDSRESAEKEIAIWFNNSEIVEWNQDIDYLLIEKDRTK